MQGGWERKERRSKTNGSWKESFRAEGIWIKESGRRQMSQGLMKYSPFLTNREKREVKSNGWNENKWTSHKEQVSEENKTQRVRVLLSVTKANKWKQVVFEALVKPFKGRNADTGKSPGQPSGQMWFYGSLKYCLRISTREDHSIFCPWTERTHTSAAWDRYQVSAGTYGNYHKLYHIRAFFLKNTLEELLNVFLFYYQVL